ncbi:phosphodiester glycosidase family protein, partial [Myxococcota bacterium]
MITFFILLAAVQPAIEWKQLEPGLELAVVGASIKSSHNDSKFTLVRIDPEKRDLKLLMVSELGGKKRTAPEWAKQHKLAVVVNAGMFEAYGDQSTAHFYMQNYKHVNNPKIAGQNAVLAFNRRDESVPRVQIIDRRCQDFSILRKKYHTLIQGIRMVDCRQKNTWSLQKKKWSMVVVAVDQKGRVLFLFTRSPYRVHNYIKMLLALPLGIHNMMYLEGGPETSL